MGNSTDGRTHSGAEFESARIWYNDNAGSGTPVKTLLASDGVAALNADSWKNGGGVIA